MKHTVAVLTAIALSCCLTPLPLHAQEEYRTVEQGAYTFRVYADHAEITDFSAPQYRTVTLPSEVEGVPVTKIADWAFNGTIWVPEFIIPDTVTEIGYDAFGNCDWLTAVTIPGSVKTIGNSAFSGCDLLASAVIEEGVEVIGSAAFYNCPELAEITFPDSLYAVNPDGSSNAKSFLKTAWYDAQPDGLLYAGHVLLGYKNRPAEDTALVIPEGTTGICGSAFYGMKQLTAVTLPDSLRSIGGQAFYGCSLSSVTIPQHVELIGRHAFWTCPVEAFELSPDNSCFTEKSGILYNADQTVLVEAPYRLSSAILPETLTEIPDYAFVGRRLTSLEIPANVRSIGENAFAFCAELRYLHFTDGLASIGNGAFSNCTSLEYILLPDSVKQIGKSAFSGCNALSLAALPTGTAELPVESLETIYEGMFDQETGKLLDPGYSTLEDRGIFYGCSNLQTLLIPKELKTIPAGTFGETGIQDTWYTGTPEEWAAAGYDLVPRTADDYGRTILTMPNRFGRIHFQVQPDSQVAGDMDLDGQLTVSDAVLMQRYLTGSMSPLPQGIRLADLDGNGVTDVFDLAILKGMLVTA